MIQSTDRPAAETDVMTLLRCIGERGEVGRAELADIMHGWGRPRVDAAVGAASMTLLVEHPGTTARLTLSARGRQEIEMADRKGDARAYAPPSFAALRQTYETSLPAYRRALEARLHVALQQRWEAEQTERRALAEFIPITVVMALGWSIDSETDPRAHNLLRLTPPPYGEVDPVYLNVIIDRNQGVLWLQPSNGGVTVYVFRGWTDDRVRDAVLHAWLPAVDPTVSQLPTLEDIQFSRVDATTETSYR